MQYIIVGVFLLRFRLMSYDDDFSLLSDEISRNLQATVMTQKNIRHVEKLYPKQVSK